MIKTRNVKGDDPLRKRVFTAIVAGTLSTGDSQAQIIICGLDDAFGGEVEACYLSCITAPATTPIDIEVANGANDIFGSGPSILASANNGSSTDVNPTYAAVSNGDVLDIDIDQVGTSTTGADLTVSIVVKMLGSQE